MSATGLVGDVAVAEDVPLVPEASRSGVSWGAIIAGAFAAAALTLILLAIGSGFGLAALSPWPSSGASARSFSIATGLWLIVTQWISAGAGGYLAGRLRVKWAGLHTHEVFFRDTAHGFLAWAVATVVGAAVLGSAASAIVGGTASATATGAALATGMSGSGAPAASTERALTDPTGYYVDLLFRSDHPTTTTAGTEPEAQATRIMLNGVRNGGVPSGDRTYLAQLVAGPTGLSQADAQKRVDDVLGQANDAQAKVRAAADDTRKAGTYVAIFAGLSMLVGAFIACIAAALGGQRRDVHA